MEEMKPRLDLFIDILLLNDNGIEQQQFFKYSTVF